MRSVSPSNFTCNNIGANTVTLTVTDVHNQSSTCAATVTINPFVNITNVAVTHVSCAGFGNGKIVISATAPGGTLKYSINGGASYQGSNSFSNLTPGTYAIRVKAQGVSSCFATATATINDGLAPQTWYKDIDNDGYSNGVKVTSCTQPAGYKLAVNLIATTGDCNDNDPLQFPGQTWYKDADNDGYSNGTIKVQCGKPTGYKAASQLIQTSGDCKDNNASIHPGAVEVCNSVDDNCNGQIDEGAAGGQTYTGNVSFATQAQVNAWPPCYSVINGSVNIIGSGITNLGPLSNLTSITGNLIIQSTSITSMNGLGSLTSVGGTLSILFNTKLTTLNGLGGLSTVGGSLFMYYNFKLNDCCAIKNLLSGNGISGLKTISFNKVGCNSVTQIMANCQEPNPLVGSTTTSVQGVTALSMGRVKASGMDIYPNPAQGSCTVKLQRMAPLARLRVTDSLGRVVFEQEFGEGMDVVTLDLNGEGYHNGVYLVCLLEDGSINAKQLIVQQ